MPVGAKAGGLTNSAESPPRSFSSSVATRRSCSSKSAFAALGLQRPRMKNTRTRNTSCPATHTHHHRFHSLLDAFWAGITFCSTRSNVASWGELARTAAICPSETARPAWMSLARGEKASRPCTWSLSVGGTAAIPAMTSCVVPKVCNNAAKAWPGP